jgi:hypothetical protein
MDHLLLYVFKILSMVSVFCLLGILVMTALIFSSSFYPFSRTYASPFLLNDNSLSGQVGNVTAGATDGSQTAGEGQQQLTQGSGTQRIILEYTNPNMGISIGYPENWDVDNLAFDRERSVTFYVYQGLDDLYGQFVNVNLNFSGETPFFDSPDMSLDQIAQQVVTFRQETWVDFQHISTEPGQVSGIPAMAIRYTYSDPGIGTTEAMEVVLKESDRLYDFVYTAKPQFFNTELGTFREMIDSVQILQQPRAPS